MLPIRETTLLEAAKKGDKSLIETCLQDITINIDFVKDSEGMAALHHAAINGHIEIAQILFIRRAKINIKNNDGNTPLHCAVLGDQKEMVQFLLQQGADYKITNNYKEILHIDTIEHNQIRFFEVDRGRRIYNYNNNGSYEKKSMFYDNFFYLQKGNTPVNKPIKNEKMERGTFRDRPTHTYTPHNTIEIVIKEGLTALELAKKEMKWEIAELISEFISRQQYSIIEATNKIETSTNQISQIYEEIKELRRITLKNHSLLQQDTYNTPSFFNYVSKVQSKYIVSVAFVLCSAIFLYEEEAFKPYKLVSLLVLALVVGYIVSQLELEWNNAKRELNEAKQQLARIKNQFSEILVEGVALIKTTRTTVQQIETATMSISNAVTALQATTDVVLLEFKDQLTGLVYELKGTGKQVADAFEYGVKHNKFKPEANVNVNVDAKLEGGLFNVFKF